MTTAATVAAAAFRRRQPLLLSRLVGVASSSSSSSSSAAAALLLGNGRNGSAVRCLSSASTTTPTTTTTPASKKTPQQRSYIVPTSAAAPRPSTDGALLSSTGRDGAVRAFSSSPSEPSPFLESYRQHVEERSLEAEGLGVAPKPLSAAQVSDLVDEVKSDSPHAPELIELLVHCVPPGVDEAAYVKATYLSAVAKGEEKTQYISRKQAVEWLGTMQGGYNVATLVELLEDSNEDIAATAARQLSHTLLVFDAFYDVQALHAKGCKAATSVLESWADAEWFLTKPKVPEKITATVFKVTGETNTDDLSPAQDAWSRPDIPLHAVAMLKNAREGIEPVKDGLIGPIEQIRKLQGKGFPLAYVGDVVGTGSSRKSATNSVLWYMGEEIPYVPNVKSGGLCLGGKIAPIFFNTMEDSGALPIELDVGDMNMGDVIDVYPYEGVVKNHETGSVITEFELKTPVILDEVRAGGRIPLIIGRGITTKAREALGRDASIDDVFKLPAPPSDVEPDGYTLAQKMVGKACGLPEGKGVVPGQYCEPRMTTVGSQDTTGPMTRTFYAFDMLSHKAKTFPQRRYVPSRFSPPLSLRII